MIKCRIAVRRYSNAKDKICDDEIIIERNCDRRRRRKKKVRIVYLGGCRSTFERFVHVARDSVVAMIRLSTAVMNASRCCNLSFVARNLHVAFDHLALHWFLWIFFQPLVRLSLSSNNQRSKSRRGSVKLSYRKRERYCVLTFKRRSSKSIRDLISFKIGGTGLDTFPSILIVDYLSNDFTSSLWSRGEIESSCRRSKLRKWKLIFVIFRWNYK